MTSTLLELLDQRTVLLDGGLGTALFARGLPLDANPVRWNLERPQIVSEVHDAFLQAGSDVLQTNTFGANAIALASCGLRDRLVNINQAASRLAHAATEKAGRGWIAGNIGPSGLSRAERAALTASDLELAFRLQAEVLADEGVDYFSLETFGDVEEARRAIAGLRQVSDLPFSACLTFEQGDRGFQTLAGEDLVSALQALSAEGAVAAGVNCSFGSESMLQAAPELLASMSIPVIFKPNAGCPRVQDGRLRFQQSPQEFAEHVAELAALGAGAVGGCCGCDERFIAALRAEL